MGKVHGGLSRAGKVKNNIPNVEKAPKRHYKTGRAKRRETYAKHYQLTAAMGGRKRGYNSKNK